LSAWAAIRQTYLERQGTIDAHRGIKPAFVFSVALLSFIDDVD
jgi:hypothetical protein